MHFVGRVQPPCGTRVFAIAPAEDSNSLPALELGAVEYLRAPVGLLEILRLLNSPPRSRDNPAPSISVALRD